MNQVNATSESVLKSPCSCRRFRSFADLKISKRLQIAPWFLFGESRRCIRCIHITRVCCIGGNTHVFSHMCIRIGKRLQRLQRLQAEQRAKLSRRDQPCGKREEDGGEGSGGASLDRTANTTSFEIYTTEDVVMLERQMDLFDDRPQRALTWRQKYNMVTQSARWKKLRIRLIERCGHKCQRCGWKHEAWNKSRTLELHHKTYERVGSELESDLEVVCSICHRRADRERAVEGRRKSADCLYNAQFTGWATKVYGENFEMHEDDSMHEQFEDWLDRKQDDY